MSFDPITRRQAGLLLLAGLGLPRAASAAPQPTPGLSFMVRLDALYIPVLSLTNAAQNDAKAAARAAAAALRLRTAWPSLRQALTSVPPSPAWRAAWLQALAKADAQFRRSDESIALARWAQAHEDLEPVRIALIQVRQAAGYDYFVDRLTAFHEPMEVLALAGAKLQPAAVHAAQRIRLEQAFAEARALWQAVEQNLPDARLYQLSSAREAQFRKGVVDETAALSRLSDTLRDSDNAALLAAAKAIKPPFARVFTAFGLAEGESLAD